MDNEKYYIDYGSWVVPVSWNDVTLKMYQDIEKYYADKEKDFNISEVLHIFTNHTQDEVNSLPVEFAEKIMDYLKFILESPKVSEPTNKITINGDLYVVNVMEKLKVGEYVAVDTILKSDKHNYAAIMAILCRKEGEIYDSKFEAEVLENRIKMFEQQPITKILPIVNFFLGLYMLSTTPTLLSSQIREAIDLTRKHIETSAQNGEVSRRSMKSAMKKLRKLEKSINSI